MICVNNVGAATATVGTTGSEGLIIRRNAVPCFIYALTTALFVLLLLQLTDLY